MKLVIVDGDTATFLPTYGAAVVVPIPTTITGSASQAKIDGKPVCLEGDEDSVESAGCMYVAPPYVIPGTGTLKISALASDQLTTDSKVEDKAVILQGSTFEAKFEVQSPAQQPTGVGPVPDSMTEYSGGSGSFVPANFMVKAN